jgi:glycerol-3-phosphate responsive antiterminator
MNEESIDNIITNLKIISLVKVDEKLSIRKGHLQIDTSSNIQFIRRWFFRDSRDIILLFIKDLIRNISSLFDKINNYKDTVWILSRIITEMENAKCGLLNLKTTYSTDPIMVVKFENVNTKFCELIEYGKTKNVKIK